LAADSARPREQVKDPTLEIEGSGTRQRKKMRIPRCARDDYEKAKSKEEAGPSPMRAARVWVKDDNEKQRRKLKATAEGNSERQRQTANREIGVPRG
jgi:hypothetical protein